MAAQTDKCVVVLTLREGMVELALQSNRLGRIAVAQFPAEVKGNVRIEIPNCPTALLLPADATATFSGPERTKKLFEAAAAAKTTEQPTPAAVPSVTEQPKESPPEGGTQANGEEAKAKRVGRKKTTGE